MSAPPDPGAHSISWCIAPPRDYAALSGAEEEMFRETDVPVRDGAALPSLPDAPPPPTPPLPERVTPLIGELPLACDERAPPAPQPSKLVGPHWQRQRGAACVRGRRRSPGLICIG